MGTSPLSPEDIRAAAGAHHELGPEYSDAVVASFLARVDQEIAARVDERLAAAGPPGARPAEPGNRRAVVKGFVMGVASSVAVVLLVAGVRPGHKALLWLLVLGIACWAGARWARRHWAIHRAALRQGPHAPVGGDYRRSI
jgi:hypothetical protein